MYAEMIEMIKKMMWVQMNAQYNAYTLYRDSGMVEEQEEFVNVSIKLLANQIDNFDEVIQAIIEDQASLSLMQAGMAVPMEKLQNIHDRENNS